MGWIIGLITLFNELITQNPSIVSGLGAIVGAIVGAILGLSRLRTKNPTAAIGLAAIVGAIMGGILVFDKLITKNPTAAIVLATIVAAIVGAIMTFAAQWFSDDRRQKQRIEGFYKAVYGELKEVWNLYNQEVGARWKKFQSDGVHVFLFNMSLTQDYFTVYSSNAGLIGQIPKSDLKLRSKIVETYTLLKVLIDYYKQNNRLLDEFAESIDENGNLLGLHETPWNKDTAPLHMQTGHRRLRQVARENLEILNFTERLQSRHHRFEKVKKELFDMIEEKFPEVRTQDSADDSA